MGSCFFLMSRRPTRSTLFPYPTLSRSQRRSGIPGRQGEPGRPPRARDGGGAKEPRRRDAERRRDPEAAGAKQQVVTHRSEEHTSELQSRQYLVCRLLLEKKKRNTIATS